MRVDALERTDDVEPPPEMILAADTAEQLEQGGSLATGGFVILTLGESKSQQACNNARRNAL